MLLKFEFNFFDIQISLTVIKGVITFSDFIVIKNILIEIAVQHAATFCDAKTRRNFTVQRSWQILLKFNWRVMDHQELFVLHYRIIFVHQCGPDGVSHFSFWVITVLAMLPVVGSWSAGWNLKFKWNDIITRLKCLCKLTASCFEIKVL